jgi:hypothetical protein
MAGCDICEGVCKWKQNAIVNKFVESYIAILRMKLHQMIGPDADVRVVDSMYSMGETTYTYICTCAEQFTSDVGDRRCPMSIGDLESKICNESKKFELLKRHYEKQRNIPKINCDI